ncbi:hypothetical protein [Kitasatospora sp. DSM 101779]|uniref:hypothetical protein n=1 Tax=Kitasatospora sp. DSM 101779 TaxID=2853165 RepID=UPI0021D9096B|nr:hypothetical protein [Kitasatospora sp. DSM 101779]MCU7827225.1 hypothetical protein [Kitasatospora sp. DSM 101779]
MSTTKPPVPRQPYFSLKIGDLTIVLKQRPRKRPALVATAWLLLGPAATLALQARHGA